MTKDKWLSRNGFEENQEYAEKVLKRFNLQNYHFSYINGELSLLIESGLKKYRVEPNSQKCSMEVYRCEVRPSFKKHTKENMILKTQFEDDCIWNVIKWIAKDSQIK